MVKHSIKNIDLYIPISTRISLALNYLKTVDRGNFREQTVEISGDDVYAMHQGYTAESTVWRFYENHAHQIDLQFVVDGTEIIRVTDGIDVKLGPGDVMILYQHEAHVPKLSREELRSMKKIVLKVPV